MKEDINEVIAAAMESYIQALGTTPAFWRKPTSLMEVDLMDTTFMESRFSNYVILISSFITFI